MAAGNIIKIGLIAGGAYLGYNYLVQSGMWAQWFGGGVSPQPAPGGSGGAIPFAPIQNTTTPASTTTGPPAPVGTAPAPVPLPVTPTIQQQLANRGAAAGGLLNVDQWVYYYQQITGKILSGEQVGGILAATGQSGSSREKRIPVGDFLAALPMAGLSGLGLDPRRRLAGGRVPKVLTIPAAAAIARAQLARRGARLPANYLPAFTPMVRRIA